MSVTARTAPGVMVVLLAGCGATTVPGPGGPAQPAHEPRELHARLADAFNAGDREALLACYDREAVLVPQPGEVTSGPEQLGEALAGYLAFKPRGARVDTVSVLVSGELALTRSDWGLQGTDPTGGTRVELHHFGVEILRRQPDGRWRFLVDHPFAADGVTADALVDRGPSSPRSLHQRLERALDAGDLEALVALYESGATLVPEPGRSVTGRDAIRAALAGFVALAPRETRVETLGIVQAGDVALTRSRWSLRGTDPARGPVTLEHHGFEVMRRGSDGTWYFVIDDPFGGDDAAGR